VSEKKNVWAVLTAAGLAVLAIAGAPTAGAGTVDYTLSTCFAGGGTGCPTSPPWGTVEVSSLSSTEVAITVQLTPGEVFAFGGAGRPLAFDLSLPGNPTVTATLPGSGWSFSQTPMTMLDGSGTWDDIFNCTTCGSGTSGGVTGPLTFDLTVSSGTITPQSFVLNNKNNYFVSDIGMPNGSGFSTGDVAAPTATVVPLPAAAWLLLNGLAGLGFIARKRAA
jgi:hypothetical protein